jgi:hypothetical protein
MPGNPENGLMAWIEVTAINPGKLPSSIDVDALWIVKEHEVWKSWFSDEERPPEEHEPNQIVKIARNGPYWPTKIYVTVVVRVINSQFGASLLSVSHQLIHESQISLRR